MSTSYPGTIDSFTNPQASDFVATVDHAAQHTNINDSVRAIENTLGTTAGTSLFTAYSSTDKPERKGHFSFGTNDYSLGTSPLGTAAPYLFFNGTSIVGGTVAASSGGSNDGWISDSNTWTYSGVDGATGTVLITGDATGYLQIGDRIGLTQTFPKYFLVTKNPSLASGTTTVIIWGGTDYTLANASITSPKYSHYKSPFGFNTDPLKWGTILASTTGQTKASPTASTFYWSGEKIDVPIGLWHLDWQAVGGVEKNTATQVDITITLSTGSATESDKKMSALLQTTGASANMNNLLSAFRTYDVTLGAATTYWLNFKTDNSSIGSIRIRGDLCTTVIRAVSSLL